MPSGGPQMTRICSVKLEQRSGLRTLIDVLLVHNAVPSCGLRGSETVEYVVSLPKDEG
jgi:hypothetical protein